MHEREGNLQDFEQGVHLILFDHEPVPPLDLKEDPWINLIRVYRRLKKLKQSYPNVRVELEISSGYNEGWLGVRCSELELEFYYVVMVNGEHIYTRGEGENTNRRFRTAFGESRGFLDFGGSGLPISRIFDRLHAA